MTEQPMREEEEEKTKQKTIDRNKVKGLDALGNSRRPCHVGYS